MVTAAAKQRALANCMVQKSEKEQRTGSTVKANGVANKNQKLKQTNVIIILEIEENQK